MSENTRGITPVPPRVGQPGNHAGREWKPGVSGNPGGRPRKLAELDPVLDEHRSPENVRAVLAKLRDLAMAGEIQAMRLYLDRVLPQLRRLEDELDLTDAPDAVLDWLAGRR